MGGATPLRKPFKYLKNIWHVNVSSYKLFQQRRIFMHIKLKFS